MKTDLTERKFALARNSCPKISSQNIHSILLSAAKMSFPIPNPIGSVTPGARNLSQASIKLIAHRKPIQIKTTGNI